MACYGAGPFCFSTEPVVAQCVCRCDWRNQSHRCFDWLAFSSFNVHRLFASLLAKWSLYDGRNFISKCYVIMFLALLESKHSSKQWS